MLGYSDPRTCPEEAYARSRNERNEIIEQALSDSSLHVIRNVKYGVNFILRQAEKLGFIRPILEESEYLAPRQFGRRAIGVRYPSIMSTELVGYHRTAYSLPLEQWPENLKQQYDEWKHWATKANVPAPHPNPRNRRATIENKTSKFEVFFGYLWNVRGIRDLDFEMLIDLEPHPSPQIYISKYRQYRKHPDVGLLEEFVNWLREQRLGRGSAQSREVASVAGSVARRYYFLRARLTGQSDEASRFDFLANAISSLRMALEEELPEHVISTESRSVSRGDLIRAAKEEFPQLNQHSAGGSGVELASRAGRALAIMMLIYHPFRNRYYREARLGEEIIQKEDKKWYLRVNNDKDEKKRGAVKREFREDPLSLEVISYLEQYLQYWRPKLVRKLEDKIKQLSVMDGRHDEQIEELKRYKKYLFLNTRGGPFTRAGFGQWIQSATYKWLGVRVNPDSIRSISLKR
jgi:hypothetical protein